jgi:hypothetical protein
MLDAPEPDAAEPFPPVATVDVEAAVTSGSARSLTTWIEALCTISTLAVPVAVATEAASARTPGEARTAAASARESGRFIA